MKKLLLFFVFSLFCVGSVVAQTDYPVTMSLNSGYVLSGTIINKSPNVITFKTTEGDIFEYRKSEIKKLQTHNINKGFRSYVDFLSSGGINEWHRNGYYSYFPVKIQIKLD